MNEQIRSFFNSGGWSEFYRSPFVTVEHHNPKNLVFQHLPVEE